MTIKELRKSLAKFRDDEYLSVNIYQHDVSAPRKFALVGVGEIAEAVVCPDCHDAHLVVLLADSDDDSDEQPLSAPRPMDFTPKL